MLKNRGFYAIFNAFYLKIENLNIGITTLFNKISVLHISRGVCVHVFTCVRACMSVCHSIMAL